jgi:nucleoid-associated protein YgaU
MATRSETALEALKALLMPLEASVSGLEVVRNPESELPVDGEARHKIAIRDGTTGEPEVSLSPVSYAYEHEAAIAVSTAKIGRADADAAFSALVAAIVDRIDGDQTLGGTVDWIMVGGLNTDEVDENVLAGFKAAIIPVTLYYTTDKALG